MQVTEVRLFKSSGKDGCVAYGSVTLDGEFVVKGIRVIKFDSGNVVVECPKRQDKNGEYKDICFPLTKTLKEDITVSVLSKYETL